MNAFHDQDMARPTAKLGQELADLPASEGFTRLSKQRQVLVFQTIQEALTVNPPRASATFENVVVAFTSLTNTVHAASCGQLNDAVLAKLESDVRISGGVIAPGLRCSGENSLASFRQATFGMLEQRFSPPVVDEIVAALNAYLRLQGLTDLGDVFQAISTFLSPVIPPTGTSPILELFNSFDNDRKALVFKTLSDAISAQPGRTAATFETIVTAYQCERSTLDNAAEGKFGDEQLKRLESSITAAGGKLLPNMFAQGDHSIASFRTATFSSLETHLSPEVLTAVLNSLNQRLRIVKARSLDALFKAVSGFLNPLLPGGWDTPTLKTFKGLDPQRQALVFRTIDLLPAPNPDLDLETFGSVVDAFCVERKTLDAAATGNLRLELLHELRASIEKAGGVLASGLKSSGDGSIGEFIERCFVTLQASISQEVYQAVLGALNAKLRVCNPNDIFALITAVQQFTEPLRQIDPTSPERANAAAEPATAAGLSMASLEFSSSPAAAALEAEPHGRDALESGEGQVTSQPGPAAAMVTEPTPEADPLADSLPEEATPVEPGETQQALVSDAAAALDGADRVSDPLSSVDHEPGRGDDSLSRPPSMLLEPVRFSSGAEPFSPISITLRRTITSRKPATTDDGSMASPDFSSPTTHAAWEAEPDSQADLESPAGQADTPHDPASVMATPSQPEEAAPVTAREPQQAASQAANDANQAAALGVANLFSNVSRVPLVEPDPVQDSSGVDAFNPITSTEPPSTGTHDTTSLTELIELIELVKLEAITAESLNAATSEEQEPSPLKALDPDAIKDVAQQELQKKTPLQMPS